jgi:hypothetical protein
MRRGFAFVVIALLVVCAFLLARSRLATDVWAWEERPNVFRGLVSHRGWLLYVNVRTGPATRAPQDVIGDPNAVSDDPPPRAVAVQFAEEFAEKYRNALVGVDGGTSMHFDVTRLGNPPHYISREVTFYVFTYSLLLLLAAIFLLTRLVRYFIAKRLERHQ